MKKDECHPYANVLWGVLIALFGVFFLIANMNPMTGMIHFWPIFLIAAGCLKIACGCMFKFMK